MLRIIIFILGSIIILILSRRSLKNSASHGFYRFFVFEGILMLLLMNIRYWFVKPFSFAQILSWIFLFGSIPLAAEGFFLLRKSGNPQDRGERPENLSFENTTNLVEDRIYRFIRHPLYSSLLFLAVGICLKHITIASSVLAILVILFAFVTAKTEERENIAFWGDKYLEYMKRTKMFIPHVL